jgi:hypothetical protein
MAGLDPGDFGGSERFQVQGQLGAGGYGVVYRALDRERNTPVALKTLRHVAAKALVRFKQEFRALADVSHPNLVTLYELSSHEDQWFFTMELIDGVNFLWYLRGDTYPGESSHTSALSSPSSSALSDFRRQAVDKIGGAKGPPTGSLNLDRMRQALPQLAEGLLALHGAEKLHRDIKPSNVLVTREGRVVLLDFGLVTELAPEHTHTMDAAGTPAYMSPEQAAGLPLTEASDWYNVGSMLYEALTGYLPFSGPVLEVMRRKQESEPAPPRELAPGVPSDLDTLCCELLRLDPARRPSGPEVLRRLRGVKGPSGATDLALPVLPVAPPFVGREQHLEALRNAFRTMKGGRAVTVAVHGGSGMGKSALVRRFLEELREQEREGVVLSGRCYERESVPFKALDALVDALSRYLRHLPSAEAEALLPHDILALARVFPVLRQVDAVNRARRAVLEIPDSQELRRRAFAALRELVVRLADRRPLVLFIDDLQWGDVDSAALLEALLRPPDSPALLLIGCYRSEEADTSPLLRAVLPMRDTVGPSLERHDIVVGELASPEARDLALALLGGRGPAMRTRAEAIAHESGGNPYFIEELVRFSQADAGPVPGGRLEGMAGGDPMTPEFTFDRVLETRVSLLSEAARRLLDVVAVAGVPIEAGVAYRASNVEMEGESALAPLRAGHLVRTRTAPGRHEIEAYHDRIRDAVVAHLSAEGLKECHHRLASALLAGGRPDPEMLATHYLGAGDAESAAEFAASAAGQASRALAFDRAAALYQVAINLRQNTPLERAKLQVQLGDALANAGRGAEAARAYLSAAAGVGSTLALDLHRRAAQQFLISGHIEDGVRVLNTVLAKLDMKLPETPRRALLSLLFRRAQIRLRGLEFRERDETEVAGQDLLRIDTCWAVGVGMAVVDTVGGADFQARHLVLALRAGEPYRVARALALEGAYVAMGGNRSRERAKRLIEASRALAERVNQPYAIGLTTSTAGFAAWLDGHWREARILLEHGEKILRDRCTGVDWEILLAQLFGLVSLFLLGEVAELSRRLPALLKEAKERGNLLRATFLRIGFCSHVVWLAADDVESARQELDTGLEGWRRGSFDYLQLWVRAARTDIALYSGERTLTPERVGAQWRPSARALDRFVQVGFIRGLDQRARRRLAAAAESQNPSEQDALLRGAERHARTILHERTRWGDPLAFLLQAGAAAARGKTEQALALLSSAEVGFTGADMALYVAAAQRRRGQLMGGDGGRSLVNTANAWMTAQGIKNPERMTTMLAPGRWSAA